MTTIVWFRQDLRLADNPALHDAAARGAVVPVYILDDGSGGHGVRDLGAASKWWLHHSLRALERSLGGLVFLRGDPMACLRGLVKQTGADAVHWNRCYEPGAMARDTAIKDELGANGLAVKSFNAALLFEPWQIETGSRSPFKVYSPFWRAALTKTVEPPRSAPDVTLADLAGLGEDLDDWALVPKHPDWAAGWTDLWRPGEAGAMARLKAFLETGLDGYGALRDRPDRPNVSRLSPHLHFGEISPRQVWAAARYHEAEHPALTKDVAKFLAELGWREFAYHLLHHFPTLPEKNWRPTFDAYPWREDEAGLKAWQGGRTGYPLVDAGMRELWRTGYMHNRVRMVAASFLIKHLRIHWKAGEAWFWDTLVDADAANNAAGWQWVAGSGADAAPYFRVFNPVGQGRKFDPDGAYVRRWCPELAALPDAFIHAPFEAPEPVLREAGVDLGRTYPRPIVDHATARAAALAGYEAVKTANGSR